MQRNSEIASYRTGSVLFRRIGLAMLSFILPLAIGAPVQSALAQDGPEQEEVELSRGEWLAKVHESRRRAEQMRREGRSFVAPPPSAEDIARENSRRALEDDSLRNGDIVATDRGLLVFKGKPTSDTMDRGDFVPLDPRQ